MLPWPLEVRFILLPTMRVAFLGPLSLPYSLGFIYLLALFHHHFLVISSSRWGRCRPKQPFQQLEKGVDRNLAGMPGCCIIWLLKYSS